MKRILVVDDKEENVYLLRILLEGNGFAVEEAGHGVAALEKARQQSPDMIIADILMPVMDGFTLCREWKKDPRLQKIPFVFYTATYIEERDRDFALSLGAEQFIVKPEEPDTFMTIIRGIIHQCEHPAAPPAKSPANGPVALPIEAPEEEEAVYLKQYNEALIRKLESKMEQLEKANRDLELDMAERKQLEANFLRAQRLETVGRLAGGVAHDLNNILTPILMVSHLMREENPTKAALAMLDTIEASAQRGAEIVKQLLTFARGGNGQKIPVSPGHLIKEMSGIIQETFPKSILLRTELPRDLSLVKGDPTQLHQVLLNLCVNASDAMPNGGTLTLAAKNVTLDESFVRTNPEAKVGPYVILQVGDTGTGIPTEIADKIFDPFFSTKSLEKGTGLGLATVLGIVKGHGGFIVVESRLGQGAQFNVYVPAVELSDQSQDKAASRELPPGHGELILVVDDEPNIRHAARQTLEKYGYRVLTASEGAEAINMYKQHQGEIQVLLTDMMMPVMDGPAAIRAVRAMNSQLKIIAATGTSEPKFAEIADIPVQAYLQKPFTAESLLVTLQKVIGGR